MTQKVDIFIHPQALCESFTVGSGTHIWAFAHVMEGATIGINCNIGGHTFIEAGASIGNGVVIKNGVLVWDGITIWDNVFVGPGAVFTNDRWPRSRKQEKAMERYDDTSWLEHTEVGEGASIGAGAVICPGIEIGAFAMIAAGSVVTCNVKAHSLVVGNPARPVGWVDAAGNSVAVQPAS